MAQPKLRLDALLVARGMCADLHAAQAQVMAGAVVVGARRADKPGELVRADAVVRIKGADHGYVSRGGLKLAAALDALQVPVLGKQCIDVGAATGGFTDCLLQRGAAAVVAVDVGYGLLHDKLRRDPRVHVRERTHARALAQAQLPFAVELLVADLSFIGLQSLLPELVAAVAPGGQLLLMVKPQFEVAKHEVPAGGVVADPLLRQQVVARVVATAQAMGLTPLGTADAGVAGPAGNQEVFVWLQKPL